MAKIECRYSEKLSPLIDGRLDGREIRQVSEHIKSCESCQNQVESFQNLKAALSLVETPPIPDKALFWANAYRESRLASVDNHPTQITKQGYGLLNWRVGSAVAAAAVIIGFAPLYLNQYFSGLNAPFGVSSSSTVYVDIAPMIRSHTSYTALQPLTDGPRISMILSDEASSREDLPADDEANATSP